MQVFLYFDEVSSTAGQEFQSVAASLQTTASMDDNVTHIQEIKTLNCTCYLDEINISKH